MALVSLALCAIRAAAGPAADGWRLDFESRLPGEVPEGWVKAWGGDVREDSFATSNMEALSGKRSLLFDRQAYDKPIHYGWQRMAPIPATGAVTVTIPFLLRAPAAYSAQFSIEVRSAAAHHLRHAVFEVHSGRAILTRGDFGVGAPMGDVAFGVWHRAIITLPPPPGPEGAGDEPVRAVLERRQADGAWTPCGPAAAVKCLFPLVAGKPLPIQVIPDITGAFRLFIDDLAVGPASGH